MQLALYRPHRWQDIGGYVIAWWCKSPYSHCELVIDGWCYSSSIRDGGVRRKQIDLTQPHWDFVELPWASEHEVKMLYGQTKDEPYGWLDLLKRQFFNRPGDDLGWFCSEWCAAALGCRTRNSIPRRRSGITAFRGLDNDDRIATSGACNLNSFQR